MGIYQEVARKASGVVLLTTGCSKDCDAVALLASIREIRYTRQEQDETRQDKGDGEHYVPYTEYVRTDRCCFGTYFKRVPFFIYNNF